MRIAFGHSFKIVATLNYGRSRSTACRTIVTGFLADKGGKFRVSSFEFFILYLSLDCDPYSFERFTRGSQSKTRNSELETFFQCNSLSLGLLIVTTVRNNTMAR